MALTNENAQRRQIAHGKAPKVAMVSGCVHMQSRNRTVAVLTCGGCSSSRGTPTTPSSSGGTHTSTGTCARRSLLATVWTCVVAARGMNAAVCDAGGGKSAWAGALCCRRNSTLPQCLLCIVLAHKLATVGAGTSLPVAPGLQTSLYRNCMCTLTPQRLSHFQLNSASGFSFRKVRVAGKTTLASSIRAACKAAQNLAPALQRSQTLSTLNRQPSPAPLGLARP